MKLYSLWATTFLLTCSILNASENPSDKTLPKEMQKILDQDKYEHSIWGILVKDLQTGEILYDQNSDKLFSPASTTKLFSVSALLNAFGDDHRFKTPVYSSGKVEDGNLQGDLILVAQGDLTMGGREISADKIAFTKMDHTIANEVPGAILTKEDPLKALNELAKQVYQKGIREISGNVIIDDSLFETVQKREMILTPILINENLIDIVVNPTEIGKNADLTWRPMVPGYAVDNQVKTVDKGEGLSLSISADDSGQKILIQGAIPLGEHDVVRTFAIKNPKSFARSAFVQALEQNGVKVNAANGEASLNKTLKSYENPQQVALWTSPPLSEYAKLILKVSHNLGADIIPLLLASQKGKKTFNEGMLLFGDYVTKEVKLSPNSFVFIDGAGGNENRLAPRAEVQLLEYLKNQNPAKFQHFFDALPILGVDGSLEDFGKNTQAAGKVRAKPGTGVALNLATNKLFLITQAYAGYIEGNNGHLFAYIVVVNNAAMPTMEDIFAIFEDEAQLSSVIFNHIGN